MIHALLITLVVITLLGDGFPFLPLLGQDGTGGGTVMRVVGILLPFLVLMAAAHVILLLVARGLDRTGRGVLVRRAESVLRLSRIGGVAWYAVAVLVLGWDGIVRGLIGPLVLVDEAITILPPIAVMLFGWFSYYPIERRLRDAVLLGRIDRGDPIHPTPRRGAYVLDQVRHQLAIVLVPVGLIVSWQETLAWGLSRFLGEETTPVREVTASVLGLLGVVAVVMVMPMVMRYLWDTIALGGGELRDRLLRLCQEQGVRCREVLLWRTHGLMLNGAVIGLLGRLRYILLTDALLEYLTDEQVEAVMAHEVGHARFHHLPWLMLAMAECLLLTGTVLWYVIDVPMDHFGLWPADMTVQEIDDATTMLTLPITLVAALIAFGWISRRFERQADAFAVQHMSGRTRAARARRDIEIAEDAVIAMSGALGAVGHFNHIPLDRFTWRHGSLRERQRHLHGLLGMAAHALPIDRTVRRLKLWLTVGGLLLAAMVIDAMIFGGGT